MPPPKVVLEYDREWKLIWKRLQSGVLQTSSRNFLYQIVHEKVFTKSRANNIMPNRYASPACAQCLTDQVEDQLHRYGFCNNVVRAWNRVRELIESLDIAMVFESDHSLIHLYFAETNKRNAILWIIGEYICYVENEVILKGRLLTDSEILNHLKSRLNECRFILMPHLGHIPDLEPTGIG